LVDRFGWLFAVAAMAAIACFLTAPFLSAQELSSGDKAEERPRPSLRNAFARTDIRWGLLTIIVSQIGLRMITVMTGPFLIDNGLTASTIGILTGTVGTALCIAFIVLSGFAIRRWTARRTLIGMLALQILSFGLFTLFALVPQQETVLSGLFLIQSAIIAGSFVALYTVIMDWTSAHQAGTDFTIFQCTDALVSVVAGFGSGIIAEHFGYGISFGIATGFAASALVLLPVIIRRTDKAGANA
ncbi:MFS transporter, partial [Marinobacter sp.]